MTAIEINKLESWINAEFENEVLEFKEARNKFSRQNLYEYCVAISNEGGGFLVLGITDSPLRPIGILVFNSIIKI